MLFFLLLYRTFLTIEYTPIKGEIYKTKSKFLGASYRAHLIVIKMMRKGYLLLRIPLEMLVIWIGFAWKDGVIEPLKKYLFNLFQIFELILSKILFLTP